MTGYDFSTMPDRRGHDAIAVDLQENDFWKLPQGETKPGFDKIPMWIADMNFPPLALRKPLSNGPRIQSTATLCLAMNITTRSSVGSVRASA